MHDILQKGDSDQLQFALENDSSVPSGSSSEPRCLTKRRRVAILVAVMIFLAFAFIVLISVVVSSRQKGTSECSSNPCKHGSCNDADDGYQCSCFKGYTGITCQDDIDECKSNPCQYGRCSEEGINKYICFCEAGYNGTNCENNIDECTSNLCLHGVCLDGINGYNCSCIHGYTGTSCEENIDECSPQPCMHGICTDGLGSYECECFAGFNGTNCDQESLENRDFWVGPVIKDSMTTFVNYTLVSGLQTYKDLRACAEGFTDNQFLAVRVNEATGECDALTWDWGSDPLYKTGYTYLRKTKTIESYHPSLQITSRLQWLLPGSFGIGGSVDLYITIPSDTTWTAFEIMMLDTTEYSFHTYDSEPEVILVYIAFKPWSVYFKVWSAGWSNKLYLKTPSLADGNAHKFTFVPQADVMQIFLDDTEVLEYTHPTDPVTAKQISIDPYGIPAIELHNITFVGV